MRLFIGTPAYGGMITVHYMQSIFALLYQETITDLNVMLRVEANESLITRGRNTIVAAFLDLPPEPEDFMMFIDADIGFSVSQIKRMLDFNRDVVIGMCPLKKINYDQAARDRFNAGEPLETAQLRYIGVPCDGEEFKLIDGFVTGIYGGTGFMMIKRGALELMTAKYPETHYTAAHNSPSDNQSSNLFSLFDCMIEPETGHYLSEDYTFCYRWRKLGGTVWLDTRSKLTHVGPYAFEGNLEQRFRW